jgi:hypothetical protein
VQRIVAQLSWGHNVILIQKLKHLPTRLWYARQTLEQGWTRETLTLQIKNRAHERQGVAITNFATTLPDVHASLASGLLKDPSKSLARVAHSGSQKFKLKWSKPHSFRFSTGRVLRLTAWRYHPMLSS